MSDDLNRERYDRKTIERHLKSAVTTLTPNVLDQIDLSAKQDLVVPLSKYVRLKKRMHTFGAAAAACICVAVLAGGSYYYQNRRIDSVIGIDVNPSIELSVNRRDQILQAEALNADAVGIMDGMDLKGVDLDVGLNAIVGSMVKHGYLKDLDNAILVTVNNDSITKATILREAVVEDIQDSLKENQVQAVVYDQQAVETDEVKELASRYGISYGKAYFLQELIAQSPDLTMDDMEKLAPMTMEEIAGEVAGEEKDIEKVQPDKAPVKPASPSQAQTQPSTEEAESTPSVQETKPAQTQEDTLKVPTEPETTQVEVTEGKVQIDYADYDRGLVYVHFKKKVKWKNPTVSVTDEAGESYSAMVLETDSESCQIQVGDLEEGMIYQFVIGGVFPAASSKGTTVTGTFETPVISPSATQEFEEEETEEEDEEETEATRVTGGESVSQTTSTVPETENSLEESESASASTGNTEVAQESSAQ